MKYFIETSIRRQLTLVLLTVVSIPLMCTIGYLVYQAEKRIDVEDKQQLIEAQRLTSEIASYVEMHKRGIEAAASLVSNSTYGYIDGSENLQAILQAYHDQFPGFINLYFANVEGTTLAFYPLKGLQGQSMIGFNFKDRWHFKALEKVKTTHVSPVMQGVGGTNKLLVTIVSPIFRDGNYVGFVLGALNLSNIQNLIAKNKFSFDYDIKVVDSLGQSISGSNWRDREPPVRELTNKQLRCLFEEEKDFGAVPKDFEKGKYVVYSRLKDLSWVVTLGRRNSERYSSFYDYLESGLLLIAGLGLLIFFIVRKISVAIATPLEILSTATVQLGKCLRPVIPNYRVLKCTWSKEVFNLYSNFSNMANAVISRNDLMKSANVALRTENQDMGQILMASLESINAGVLLCSPDNQTLYLSNKLRKLIGQDALFPASVDEVVAVLRKNGFKPLEGVSDQGVYVRDLFGTPEVLSVVNIEVEAVRGIIGRMYLFYDITEEYQMEQMKDSLISVVAHEMKTPIASLRLASETLLRKDMVWNKEVLSELLRDIGDITRELEKLVSDWLDVSRIEGGAISLNKEATEINTFIRNIFVTFCDDALNYSIKGEFVVANVDREKLQHCIKNLISNAIRYSDGGVRIDVEISRVSGFVIISFTDYGIGIPDDQLPKVFDKFHQVNQSNTRRPGGTGLGLTIVKGLIEAHGGSIEVSSEFGKWTAFKIRLPL